MPKLAEIIFDGKIQNELVKNGRFTGSISLQNSNSEVREKNNILANNLPALMHYNAWTDHQPSEWEQTHERLHVMLPFPAEPGDILVIDGGDNWDQQLRIPNPPAGRNWPP